MIKQETQPSAVPHPVHIPVMGTGFTIDTPIKVAKYGISSVISLVDDTLIEEMRGHYCKKFGLDYEPITRNDPDHRARRITAYLNLVDQIVRKQFAELKASTFELGSEITKYFELLPETSPLKALYQKMLKIKDPDEKQQTQDKLRNSLQMGSIDVNIMTKLDRTNFEKSGQPLPPEYSDALSALRGYAKSKLQSAIVLSAGINQKLYTYLSEFKDFYADKTGHIRKQIVLKVSDYRSSFIQGKFFAKKGIWVSEYRIESGLNCGGHAFASTGQLMGPILEEFKTKRDELISKLHAVCNQALQQRSQPTFSDPLPVRVTAQGGIGTHQEDVFLRECYQLDGTGWGTPFLLCPEVVNIDRTTLHSLVEATKDDIYLSPSSPIGVPFSNLRSSASEQQRRQRMKDGHPGSPCFKGHLAMNTEFENKPLCPASRVFQKLKLEQLKAKNLPQEEYERQANAITAKSCICHDLGGSTVLVCGINGKVPSFPAICPGPNLAFFSKEIPLTEMMDHIYGRGEDLTPMERPNMFLNELRAYIDHFIEDVNTNIASATEKQKKHFVAFKDNLFNGIEYYQSLFPSMARFSKDYRENCTQELQSLKNELLSYIRTLHSYTQDIPELCSLPS